MFNLKLDSWLTDFVADLNAPAGAPPVGLEGTPLAPAAPPTEHPYGGLGPAPYAPASSDPRAPTGTPARHGPSQDGLGGPSPLQSRSSPDAFGGPSPLALPPQGPDPHLAPPILADPLSAPGAPAASAVPPIPAFTASAVPPIPGLAGGGPQFEEPGGRWPLVLVLVLVLVLLAGGGGAWFFFGAQLRALLHP